MACGWVVFSIHSASSCILIGAFKPVHVIIATPRIKPSVVSFSLPLDYLKVLF